MTDGPKDGAAASEPDAEEVEAQTIVSTDDLMPDTLLILPLPNRPVFPNMLIPLIMPPGREANLVEAAFKTPSRMTGLVLKKETPTPGPKTKDGEEAIDLYRVGTVAHIEKINRDENGALHAILTGRSRFRIKRIVSGDPLAARVDYHQDEWDKHDREIKAYSLSIVNTLKELIKTNPLISEELRLSLTETNVNEPGRLADFGASLTSADREDLQEILETFDIHARLKHVLALLKEEMEIAKIKERINQQIEEKLSKQQREFFLREQLKAIKEELGLEKDEKAHQFEEFKTRLEKLTLPEEALRVIESELDKFSLLAPQSPEFTVTTNYLDWLLGLPWGIYSEESLDVAQARQILDRDHYGLAKVKDRILEFIGVSKLKGTTEGTILCFIGPPGVGKTSLGQSIAKSLNREFFRFSLGGMRDEAEIKGHRRTYIGAMPGKIIQALRRCGAANPLIMLDEIDKVGHSFRGDPASALLEVLDPEQNHAFLDHYMDVKFDLSKVLFIATANVYETIPGPLLDRMDIMPMAGYIKAEKIGIAQRHLVPKQLKAHGLKTSDIAIRKAAIGDIVDGYTREAGVRRLDNTIKAICRKTAATKAEKPRTRKVIVTPENLEDFLGKRRFTGESFLSLDTPGVVIGLAWTAFGGTILFIESSGINQGKGGGFMQTGQLGDVMVESSRIAYSHVRSIWGHYAPKDRQEYFEKNMIHLHVPAGATPKDGPSAGITMGVSLISLASGVPIMERLAMTGELTLTGRVLPIGGLKEKLIAARSNKLKKIIVPSENRPDYDEIPDFLKKGIKAHFVTEFHEVVRHVFGKRLKRKRRSN
ncbi:endopeptidase La [Planctomycetota bacterium]